jgi:uncharacterized protein
MDITPLLPKGRQLITGYGDGGFKINHEFISGSLLVFPDQTLRWDIADIANISQALLEPVLQAAPSVELLLLGTGSSIVYVDPAIRQALKARGIGLDIMDTGAACRTYNVLITEERRVAAALIAV